MARIEFRGMAHNYRPTPPGAERRLDDYALKPLNHVWQQGGAYALLGPSGCGKTTLLNIVSGLLRPSEGQVFFDDLDVTNLPTEQRNIAQVFQFPVVYDTMTVYENLAFPLRNRGMRGKAVDDRVREIAALLDLTGDLNRRGGGLTADAKQIISLGRGLVRPDVAAILFDEPLTVIDPHLKWELRSKLKALHRALDLTMIYVTHDQTEALSFADTVVVMHDGSVVQMGRPDELFEKPAHVFVGHFIGSPGMNIFPAEVDGNLARVGGHTITLNQHYSHPGTARVELGIRPEFVQILPPGQGLPVRVTRIDDLGRSRIARVELSGMPLAATMALDVPLPGSDASVSFDPRMVHLYADGHLMAGSKREAA